MSGERLRILVLGDSRSFHIERYLIELRRQNCEVLVASIEPGRIDYYQLRWRGPFRKLHYLLAAEELRELIKKFEPDVIDAHYATGYGHMAARALKDSDIPLVVQLWGSDILVVPRKSFLHKRKAVTALREADAVVADSQFLLDEAGKLAPLKRTLVEPFGIEKRFMDFHKNVYTLSSPLKVIVPRPHEKVYNNSFILKALRPLLENRQITLTFPDFGSLALEFKWEIKGGDYPGIIFYERMDRESFMRYMAEHDVFLSAAVSDSSPASLIEAMGLGLIPIVARIPGVEEWTKDCGDLTFDVNDPKSLRDTMIVLANNQDKQMPIRKRNLELVMARGMFENNVAARINLMRQLIAAS